MVAFDFDLLLLSFLLFLPNLDFVVEVDDSDEGGEVGELVPFDGGEAFEELFPVLEEIFGKVEFLLKHFGLEELVDGV